MLISAMIDIDCFSKDCCLANQYLSMILLIGILDATAFKNNDLNSIIDRHRKKISVLGGKEKTY